jgi:hypothetical protein
MHMPRADRPLAEDRPGGIPAALAIAGLSGWLVTTIASQHPHRAFDRFRDFDPIGLLVPNWRFFAPEPAMHDFHLLHRVLEPDGEATSWEETIRIPARVWRHAAWHPERRRDKAMFDVCNELVTLLAVPSLDVTATAAYRLLRDHVEVVVRAQRHGRPLPQGFQFLIVRHTGHDDAPEPDYLLASAFEPLRMAAAA